jgi:DNA-binding transcriptional MerR regulator
MDKESGAYRTISEVGEELDIPQHVLRFWETRFPQIKPMKRSGGRRYYRPPDVLLLRGIRRLLYGEGYTIKGVQRILATQGVGVVQRAGGASGEEFAGIADVAATDDPAAVSGASLSGGEARAEEPYPRPEDSHADALASDALPVMEDMFQDRAAVALPASGGSAPALSSDERGLLQDALDNLSECARLLDLLHEVDPGRGAMPEQR